jgi:molybdate transport system substrate-binding protein
MSTYRNLSVAGITGLVLTLSLGMASPVRAGYAVAPDVVVFCPPTLRHAVSDVGALWRQQTGVPVRIFTSPTEALLQQIAHHARDDVLIGEGDGEARAATGQNLVQPETLRKLWRNQLVVAAPDPNSGHAGSNSPAAAGNLAALAGRAPIAIVDPWAAPAGAESKTALQSLGLWQAVSSKSLGVVGTADASFLLAQGKVKLAIVYETDVAADPNFSITDRLPAAGYQPIVYWVALTEHALSPNAARFVAFLDEAPARQRLRADGLEVLP